jgi:hypothetical protein
VSVENKVKIIIIAMKTWGEFGNYRSGEVLCERLSHKSTSFELMLMAGDELVDNLGAAGNRMRAIANENIEFNEKRTKYLDVISSLEEIYAEDFELSQDNSHHIEKIISVLKDNSPHIVICMKGILTRLVRQATNFLVNKPFVINFITNQGLLDFSIHQSKFSDLDIAPSKFALEKVASFSKFSNIHIYHLSKLKMKKFLGIRSTAIAHDVSARTVFILCNKGGAAYVNIFKEALYHQSQPRIVAVIINDHQLFKELETLRREFADRVELFNSLSQIEYIGRVESASRSKGSFLISKIGPNTFFESVMLELPVLMHYSWLPMEDWIGDEINRNQFGVVVDIKKIAAYVNLLLDNPAQTETYKKNIVSKKENYLDHASQIDGHQILNNVLSYLGKGQL